jgi:hypothetical protein
MSSIGISLFSEKKMMDVPEEYIYMLSLLSFVGWKVPLIGGNSSEI